MRAVFYVDGFNFYYLRTKKQPHFKWLNMKSLADTIVPAGTSVHKVNYYTAPVSGKVDPDAPRRQQALMSAFRTVPEIEVFNGSFMYSEKWSKLIHPPKGKIIHQTEGEAENYIWNMPPPDVVYVAKAEEKGSDVNLGVHLVRDAFLDRYDIAYVITNDTDLVEPIRIVSQEIGKLVCIVAPNRPDRHSHRPIPSPSLAAVSTSVHYIDDAELAASQFPVTIPRHGKKPITKPPSWV